MHRFGIVSEVDPATGEVRVVFPAHEDLPSYWLPLVLPFTLGNAAYWLPDLNTQVLCALDEEGEPIAVFGGVYSEVDKPPVTSADKTHIRFKDGTTIEYDRAAHRLEVTVKGGDVVLNVDAGKAVHVGGEGGEQLATKSFVQTVYLNHVHPHPMGPTGIPVPTGTETVWPNVTRKGRSE